MYKKILLTCLLVLVGAKSFAATVWLNDMRTFFQANAAVIYAINIRTFNAKDLNQNGIIEEKIGEERGDFVNAVDRLDELALSGVNTIHLLPIMSVGSRKALGTAGSLYALSSFTEINPQLKSHNSKLSVKAQAKQFIEECHKRKIRVIVDMPPCASYDLFLKRPDIFVKDKSLNSIVPADWTDVRLLDAGKNGRLNLDVYNLYRDYVDLVLGLGADGIVASVPTIKPSDFWKDLIDYTRIRNPQFLFLAEASDMDKPISPYASFTPYDKLLAVGFDGYYGGYSRLKDWKLASELISHVQFNEKLFSKYDLVKSSIGSFATHNDKSPITINGEQYSIMIAWLNATLPLNAYYVDGFSTGDDYLYPWNNKRASKTYTDDDFYFVHSGELDIFNFSRKPGGGNGTILQEFVMANKFKLLMNELMPNSKFVPLISSSPTVFAYSRTFNNYTVLVIGNLDFSNIQDAKVNVPKLTEKTSIMPVKGSNEIPIVTRGRISAILGPGEVQVMLLNNFSIK